jgi:hypothetical protein
MSHAAHVLLLLVEPNAVVLACLFEAIQERVVVGRIVGGDAQDVAKNLEFIALLNELVAQLLARVCSG